MYRVRSFACPAWRCSVPASRVCTACLAHGAVRGATSSPVRRTMLFGGAHRPQPRNVLLVLKQRLYRERRRQLGSRRTAASRLGNEGSEGPAVKDPSGQRSRWSKTPRNRRRRCRDSKPQADPLPRPAGVQLETSYTTVKLPRQTPDPPWPPSSGDGAIARARRESRGRAKRPRGPPNRRPRRPPLGPHTPGPAAGPGGLAIAAATAGAVLR